MKRLLDSQFLRFLAAGGVAALANIGSRALFSLVCSYAVSIVLAYLVGMVVAYTLNRAFVFQRSERRMSSEAFWFVIVNIAGVLQTLGVSLLLTRLIESLWHGRLPSEALAHMVGVAVPVFTSFIGHKYVTFRRALADGEPPVAMKHNSSI